MAAVNILVGASSSAQPCLLWRRHFYFEPRGFVSFVIYWEPTSSAPHAALPSSLAPRPLRMSSALFPQFPRENVCQLSKLHSTALPFSLALSPAAPGRSSRSHR